MQWTMPTGLSSVLLLVCDSSSEVALLLPSHPNLKHPWKQFQVQHDRAGSEFHSMWWWGGKCLRLPVNWIMADQDPWNRVGDLVWIKRQRPNQSPR